MTPRAREVFLMPGHPFLRTLIKIEARLAQRSLDEIKATSLPNQRIS
jgi:hypothetical protein